MGEVNLKINGMNYPILCDDGQEGRINELAKYIDARLKDISKSGAANNDNHLLVLTALILADEVFDLRSHLEAADELIHETSNGTGMTATDQAAIVESLSSLANRITIAANRIRNS